MGRVSRLNKQEKTSWTLAFISLLPDNAVWPAATSPPMMHCALSLTQEALPRVASVRYFVTS